MSTLDNSHLYTFLDQHDIQYDRYDHAAVFTVEQAQQFVPELTAVGTKNLFLRDKKGKRHILLTVDHDKQVDLKSFGARYELGRLSFASADRLKRLLGIEPGSVSILALVNDVDHAVEFCIDEDLSSADALQCHPLINTATLVISRTDIDRFLTALGRSAKLVAL